MSKEVYTKFLPEDWNTLNLKNVTEVITDYVANGSFASLKENVKVYDNKNFAYYVRLYDLRLGLGHKDQKFVDEVSFDFLSKSSLYGGEILIANIGANVGEVWLMPKVDYPATLAPNMIMLKNNDKVDNKYLFYFLTSDIGQSLMMKEVSGSGQPKLNKTGLKEVPIVTPPLKEQEKIAQILSSVDAAIEKTKQVIAKTEEVKKGLMQQLLTKGIGHTEFKQTEIGEIPLTWDLVKLEEVTELITKGTTPTTYGYKFEDNGVNFIKVENLRQSINSNQLLKISYECHKKLERSQLQVGDILFSIAGTLGSTYIVDESILPCNTNQALSIIRLKNNLNICYINYVLNSNLIQKEIDGLRTVGAQPNLNLKQVGNFTIPFPPIEEQDRISQIIKKNEEMIYNEIKKLRKLKSLKQGLMKQLLTGTVRMKVD